MLTAGGGSALAQSDSPAPCINALNKSGQKVAKAVGREVERCVSLASGERLPSGVDAADCLLADSRGKVSRAAQRTFKVEASRCATGPSFGATDATTVNDAARDDTAAIATDLLGDDIPAAIVTKLVDASGARCQRAVVRAAMRTFDARLAAFTKCKRTGLGNGSIDSRETLGECLAQIVSDVDSKIARMLLSLADAATGRCGDLDVDALFPGSCAGAADFAQCVGERTACRACLALDRMDGLDASCDGIDNETIDGSCRLPDVTTTSSLPISTTTTTTTTTSTSTTLPEPVCGNAVLESGEDCDDGNAEAGDCCSASCTFETAGASCSDGNPCTDSECDGSASCVFAGYNAAPCDDGVFCNGTDMCSEGACSVHAGDPCAGQAECRTFCDEATASCNSPAGTQCTDDGNVCTDDACDGAGTCAHTANSAPCDDGDFCNGSDTCSGGSCSVHSGDPCTGGADCADTCDETADSCLEPAGTACNDDGDPGTSDLCDGSGQCVHDPITDWMFFDVTSAAGLGYVHAYDETQYVNPELERAIISGGVAVGDYDGDGWIDLYAVGGAGASDRLLRNTGDGTFIDVTAASGIVRSGLFGSGPVFVDYDGDGHRDIIVGGVNGTPVAVLRNVGNGSFSDATAVSGISVEYTTFGAALGDTDRDGDLDLYLAHWQHPIGSSARLWRNNGNGTFTDITSDAGLDVARGSSGLDNSFTPNFADINDDGWPDLVVAADFGTSQVFLNDGDGTFTDATTTVIDDENGMGAAVGDYDNDGDLDWFVSSIWDPDGMTIENWGVTGNRLYRNAGAGVFEDATEEAGVREGYWGWGSCMADFNLDGHLDIFHVNGFSSDSATEYIDDPSRLFIAAGDGSFVERSAELGLLDEEQGRGVSCFDYDRDGDIDILVANNDGAPRLWKNSSGILGHHFLHVDLTGNIRNSDAIGARVFVTIGNETQMREIRAGSNYASQDPAVAHFGLGAATSIDEVRVEWPDGAITALQDEPADQFLELTHPDFISPDDQAMPTMPQFTCPPDADYCNVAVQAGLADVSRYGRGAAIVDIDGDDWEDLFLVDADNRWTPTSYGVSMFFRNNGDATFSPLDVGLSPDDLYATYTGAFGDYDNDGDPDLLLVNGAFSGLANLAFYENRMNENGQFVSATMASGFETAANAEPRNWWGASWADFNGDGLLDVAVTQRFGATLLMRNNGDKSFTDVAATNGIVSNSNEGKNPLWTDYDVDGDPDLYVSGLYTHALYRNDGASGFVDVTATAMPDPFPTPMGVPWSFAASAADFDQDGFDDLYIGRLSGQDVVLMNDGAGTFDLFSDDYGLDTLPWENTMGLGVGDLFDDGFPDVVIGSGYPSEAYHDVAYCNQGTGFVRCSEVLNAGADRIWRTRGHGTVFGDIDKDGDTDMVLNLGGHPEFDTTAPGCITREAPALFLRQSPLTTNTATVVLEGTTSNRDAIGASLEVAGSATHYYTVRSVQGFQSQNSNRTVVTLGTAPTATVTITWPSGTVDIVSVDAGETLHLVE